MSIGIYKITNQLNNKSYIGQSIHIERRWQEHKKPSTESVISTAIKEYGVENFSFEILELCSQNELDIKEKYWMSIYNSIVPYGYNVSDLTESQHTQFHHFNKETLMLIIQDIKISNDSFSEIAQKYNLNVSTISRINAGQIHYQDNEKYPLRNTGYKKYIQHFCLDCNKPISETATRCNSCEGKFRKLNNLQKLPISRTELKNLIRTTPFTKIGQMFNVSDNAIRKWCDNYQLPRKSSDIKKFTDEEWKKL